MSLRPGPTLEENEAQIEAVETGFADALRLATAVVDNKATLVDPILEKYFNTTDTDTVTKVFQQVLGPRPEGGIIGTQHYQGNSLLDQIFVQKLDRDKKCSPQTLAYTGDGQTDDPFICMCDLVFKHKSLDQTACNELGDNVSWKMMTLGGTLLHEYM